MCIGWLGEILMYIQVTNNGKLLLSITIKISASRAEKYHTDDAAKN